MVFEDKTLTCKECGAEFVFTAGEQEFYAEYSDFRYGKGYACCGCGDLCGVLLHFLHTEQAAHY